MLEAPPTHDRRRIALSIALSLVVLFAALGVVVSLAPPAAGQTDVSVDGLSVADAEHTVSGDVSDVTVTADLAFSHEVPDADQRIVTLRAGPDANSLQDVTFAREDRVSGTDSGSVTLTGSLLDAGFSADQFDPAAAESTETEVVVEAVVEIERANGDRVTETARETATVRVTDDTTLVANIGGDVAFEVEE